MSAKVYTTNTNRMSFIETNCLLTNQTVGISASNGCFEGPRTSMMVTPRNLTVQDVLVSQNSIAFQNSVFQEVPESLMRACMSDTATTTTTGGTTSTECKLDYNLTALVSCMHVSPP